MLSPETFAAGPVKTPWPIRGDAYTVSSDAIVSQDAKRRSVYNFTNRKSPCDSLPSGVAKDGRMCLYGLVDFIQRELTTPVSSYDVGVSQMFMRDAHSFGGPLGFDVTMWNRVVDEYNGYLPIKIEALPEGSTFWTNEPVIQVTSLDSGFGEIAAIIEATMVGYVANATARLTLTRHLLERVRETVKKYHPTYTLEQVDGVAQWMIHDFGMRASSTPQESEIYGRAHLLCFNGTDTFNAAFQAWGNNANRPIGTSILALAHRIVMGFPREDDAYNAMYDATQQSIGSYVADCYDFHDAVKNFLVAIAKRGKATVVARPDSGDYLENVLFVVEEALKHELYKPDEENRLAATTLRFIQGDSMNWEKISRVFSNLAKMNADPTGWGIFGVGGWLRNTPNRDTFSSAYKLCAFGSDNTPCVKLSDTPAKMSIPGPTVVVRPVDRTGPTVHLASESFGLNSAYQTYYDGSKKSVEAFGIPCLEDFNTQRHRVIHEFDASSIFDETSSNVLSRPIIKLQYDTMKKFGKNIADYTF